MDTGTLGPVITDTYGTQGTYYFITYDLFIPVASEVQLDLHSTEFDPYLDFWELDDQGACVWGSSADNDSGPGWDAQWTDWTIIGQQWFALVTTNQSLETGSFTLTVTNTGFDN